MRRPLAPSRDPSRSSGFVLVGVVIFVLALTILGLSLFSLSTYEADFFGRSSDQAQAFYSALGGIEWAKFMLLQKGNLASVGIPSKVVPGTVPPMPDIVYVRVSRYPRQVPPANSDTTGGVPWGQPVDIRVLAVHNGERSMIEQRFIPQ